MNEFCTQWSIDIFKNAVSIPGVSMQFVLRGVSVVFLCRAQDSGGSGGVPHDRLQAMEVFPIVRGAGHGSEADRWHWSVKSVDSRHEQSVNNHGSWGTSCTASLLRIKWGRPILLRTRRLSTGHSAAIFVRESEQDWSSVRVGEPQALYGNGQDFQIGITVYQLAKLWMLKLYYDFWDYYVHRQHFKLIQMDMGGREQSYKGSQMIGLCMKCY